jgi:hypothetical protein
MALVLCEPCLIDRIQQLYLDGLAIRDIANELGRTEFEILREIDAHIQTDPDDLAA